MLLAASLGRMLTDTCYVLDEPTAGLHSRDTERLMHIIRRLRDIGNTVLVVEHDPDVIAEADHVIELGPRGGDRGGEIVFEGTLAELEASDTATGDALRSRQGPDEPDKRRGDFLTVRNACLHNLRDASASFRKKALNVVTGVSGSGKSTLVVDVLHPLLDAPGRAKLEPAVAYGGEDFSEVVLVEQGAIARSQRSCAMTLSGAYGPVRELLASTEAAQQRGLTASHFSFNVPGGRCEHCDGLGVVSVEMHFVADVSIPCPVCEGKRFSPKVLACRYRGKSVSDIFKMTIDEALQFFELHTKIASRLAPLAKVGLGYLRLGQTTNQISGGEGQRLKLASYIGKSNAGGPRLFIFDEPTVGLHLLDVDRLLRALRELIDGGDTVVVIEHNLDFIARADWVVDLGPDAGPRGGSVVYEGPVAGLIGAEESLTGRYLQQYLESGSRVS